MEVNYQLTPDDFYLFRRYWWLHRSKKKAWMMVAFIAAVSILSCVLVLLQLPFHFGLRIGALLSLVTFSFIILFFFLLYKPFMKWCAKLIPGFLNARRLIISEECLIEQTSAAEIKVKWNQIATLEETDNALYFFLNQSAAFIIPKRAFLSPAEVQIFLAFSRRSWEVGHGGQHLPAIDAGTWPPPPKGQ